MINFVIVAPEYFSFPLSPAAAKKSSVDSEALCWTTHWFQSVYHIAAKSVGLLKTAIKLIRIYGCCCRFCRFSATISWVANLTESFSVNYKKIPRPPTVFRDWSLQKYLNWKSYIKICRTLDIQMRAKTFDRKEPPVGVFIEVKQRSDLCPAWLSITNILVWQWTNKGGGDWFEHCYGLHVSPKLQIV